MNELGIGTLVSQVQHSNHYTTSLAFRGRERSREHAAPEISKTRKPTQEGDQGLPTQSGRRLSRRPMRGRRKVIEVREANEHLHTFFLKKSVELNSFNFFYPLQALFSSKIYFMMFHAGSKGECLI